ncbi:MAG: DUF5618 family protein [Nitrospinae bacterium]|nr:DUF5618 family protein [Nitrospinota bacterium]
MKEAIRYIENAKEILNKSKIEDNMYVDDKYVKSACGVAYLGVLKAIEDYLQKSGFTKKELPKSVDAYREMIKKHLSIYNGKLIRQFENLYDELHIAGYYRGLLHRTSTVKDVLKGAEEFIKKIK